MSTNMIGNRVVMDNLIGCCVFVLDDFNVFYIRDIKGFKEIHRSVSRAEIRGKVYD